MRARIVLPEQLDHLSPDDPLAQQSRHDLQRLHRVMGTRSTALKALRAWSVQQAITPLSRPLRVLELGAGDGSLMLGVAQALDGLWPSVELTLLDQQPLLQASTVAAYAGAGWQASALVQDALTWAAGDASSSDASSSDASSSDGLAGAAAADTAAASRPAWDLIVTHLFLHHFEAAPLANLLAAVAQRCRFFLAVEPRRAWPAWVGSHLVGALGANAITREDAVLSVRAGFHSQELSAAWPAHAPGWRLNEQAAGLFSHSFVATLVTPQKLAATVSSQQPIPMFTPISPGTSAEPLSS